MLFLGWGGSGRAAGRSGAPHSLPPLPTPFLPSFPPSCSPLPTKPGLDISLSRGWCSAFPSGMGPGWEANPATHAVFLCVPERGDREKSGHHHCHPHQRAPNRGQGQTNPAAEKLVWLLPSLLCPPRVTWGQADGL